jgi:hypothetical protein
LQHTDDKKIPETRRSGQFRFKNQSPTIGDVEVVYHVGKKAPLHLEVLNNSKSTTSQSFPHKR